LIEPQNAEQGMLNFEVLDTPGLTGSFGVFAEVTVIVSATLQLINNASTSNS
jgi:hypothetical protein